MSQNCTPQDCGSCKLNCPSRMPQHEKLHPASSVKKVIAVMSGKGGVGKSMVTSLLATITSGPAIKPPFWMQTLPVPPSPRPLAYIPRPRAPRTPFFPFPPPQAFRS